MKTTCHILILLFLGHSLAAQQFYVRGEVKDEAGNVLQNVVIKQFKTGYVFRSGASGTFGILAHSQLDTFSFMLDGYHPEKMLVNADNYIRVKLKPAPASASNRFKDRLSSFTKDLGREEQKKWFAGDESYASLLENRFLIARQFPSTGMSLNVDRASYSNIRRFITMNSIVPPDAVRIEEMLNYFNLDYYPPAGDDLFYIKPTLTACPWNPGNQLYYINLSSRKLNLDTLPPSNLVFLIDVSGSMDMPNRLPLLQSAFRLLVNNLRNKDSVSIVVYGGVTGVMLETTSGAEKEKIIKAIDELTPGGSTPGEAGIRLAYTQARRHFIQGGNNRVILATDGDFNVGLKTESELDEMISAQRESGVYLTCLGVGMGNYKDSKIQLLAEKGNGNFAYLDNFKEAEKVLLKEFTQTLYSVADDVYMNVEFNPEYVKEYRLIGFDNKVGALRDASSVVEGGEIGSGFSMIAMFEIEPTELSRGAIRDSIYSGQFANIRLQYRHPGDTTHRYFDRKSNFDYRAYEKLEKCYHFSAAVAQFGSMLRNSPFVKNRTWNDMVEMAQASAGDADLLQKEFVNLTIMARNLYMKGKKRKSQ
ncbi:MAG TPA: von Willebrand factor type A domain-containing protein [Chitinophagaceae bacterium]|nr:von Willebrand factor type A domain-containing protein [Chitinophagaceae bacterium]HPH32912.1 von Willebrand factor type A domain-containing protein [Chitinophagaceae bacterium]